MKTLKKTSLAVLTAGALVFGVPQLAFADASGKNSAKNVNARVVGNSDDSRYIGDSVSGVESRAAVSTRAARFIARVDAHDAHISGSEVSGKTSWTLIQGTSRKLEVRSTLKAKTGWFGYSTKKASPKTSVWPGGGRGKWAIARYTCKGKKKTQWYTYGEGWAPGTQKPFGYHKGDVKTLACGA